MPRVKARPENRGFTLLELMLALALGALVLAGLLRLTQATTAATRAQQALAGLQAAARFAESELRAEIAAAGFVPEPWTAPAPAAVDGSLDGASPAGDRLVLRRRSRINCLGNANPVRDGDGSPAAWLRESIFALRDGWRLVKTCRYGPPAGPGVRQLNAATLVEGVEAFQLLFAEDDDGDGRRERWVPAGAWSDEGQVIGVRLGLLLASPGPVGARPRGGVDVLDHRHAAPDDGRLRLVLESTVPLRGRQP